MIIKSCTKPQNGTTRPPRSTGNIKLRIFNEHHTLNKTIKPNVKSEIIKNESCPLFKVENNIFKTIRLLVFTN